MSTKKFKSLSKRLEVYSKAIYNFVASNVFLYITFGWFIFQGIWLAVSTGFGIAPDETYHFGLTQLLERNGWLPIIHNQAGFYYLGQVKHTPYILYEYLMSLPLHFFSGYTYNFVIIRLINVLMAVGSVYLLVKIADNVGISKVIRNISLFMFTNTLMFIFLSASVSYDNLFILLTFGAFYLLLKLIDKFTVPNFMWFLLIIIAGFLVKISFFPIAFICVVILLFKKRSQISSTLAMFPKYVKANPWRSALLVLPLVLVLLLVAQRFGVNVIKYHALNPACPAVNTLQQCQETPIYNRTVAFSQLHPTNFVTPFDYLTGWISAMRQRTFGILGQASLRDSVLIRYWSQILIVAGFAVFCRKYFPRKDKKIDILVILITFYATVLILINYHTYRHIGDLGLAVQGRYLFAVLPLMIMLMNKFFFEFIKSLNAKAIYLIVTLVVFVTAGLPTFMLNTKANWYTPGATAFNSKVNQDVKRIYNDLKHP